MFSHCPKRAGEPELLGDDRRELDGRGGDEPDPLTFVEMALRDGAGARPHLLLDDLIEDLFREVPQLADGAVDDERQRRGSALSTWSGSSAPSRKRNC